MSINVSINTVWKFCWLWKPWGWMLSTVHSSFKWVMYFLLHKFQCQRSIQACNSCHNSLDGGSLASYCSQHAWRHILSVSLGKRSHQRCFGRMAAQGSAIATFNPLAAQRCVLLRQGFSSQALIGQVRYVQQRFTGSVGKNGHVDVLEKVYQLCLFCP